MTDHIGGALAGRPRAVSFGLVAGAYLIATLIGVAVFAALTDQHPLVRTLAGDLAATAAVFAASSLVNNASVYDPYWSVAPPVIVIGWLAAGFADGGVAARQLAVAVLVAIWGVRLTANWATGWRGLAQEDWRYGMLRRQTAGRLPWWFVNLTGIQLMPTLVVYIGLLPVWPALTAGGRPFGALDMLAVGVTAGAIAVEAAADLQLRRFAADPANHGRVADVGLWRFSRHPNYVGEIGFWFGLYLFGVAAAPGWWWTAAGPLVMVLLFAMVSVPMMDRRSLARRPGYAAYAAAVPALLPLPRRRRIQW